MGQRIREIDPRKYSGLTFDKGAKATQWSKDGVFSSDSVWNTCKIESRARPHTFREVNSKCITDLNVKHETAELLGNKIGESEGDLGLAEVFS